MRNWRGLALLVALALGAAAVWFVRSRQAGPEQTVQAEETPRVAYDYEAQEVVVRQMGSDGRLAFQVEAKEITQLPGNGHITARGIILYHDPPGTVPGSPNRWTLTADSADLPAEGGVITLAGKVRAHGIPASGSAELTVATEQLRYDMTAQELSSDDMVQLKWGSNTMQGRVLKANIRTGDVTLESEVHGSLAP